MPDCPPGFVDTTTTDPAKLDQTRVMWIRAAADATKDAMDDNIARWSLRGGIATGMAVYSYLRGGGAQGQIKPYYNQCQLLK